MCKLSRKGGSEVANGAGAKYAPGGCEEDPTMGNEPLHFLYDIWLTSLHFCLDFISRGGKNSLSSGDKSHQVSVFISNCLFCTFTAPLSFTLLFELVRVKISISCRISADMT